MVRLFVIVLLIICGGTAVAQEPVKAAVGETPAGPATQAGSGVKYTLDEERYVAAFQKEGLPKFEKEIEGVVGARIPAEVDFPTFAGDFDSMQYIDGSWCTGEIVSALKQICTDDIGKRRTLATIKKIVIKNVPDVSSETAFKIDGGTLVISCHLKSSGVSSTELVEFLKKNL